MPRRPSAAASKAAVSTPDAKVAALSEAILESLLRDQKKAPAPKGMQKCPRCGAAVAPTKNGRIRTHDADPYERLRCPASGKPWKDFGGEPESGKKLKRATKQRATKKAKPRDGKKRRAGKR